VLQLNLSMRFFDNVFGTRNVKRAIFKLYKLYIPVGIKKLNKMFHKRSLVAVLIQYKVDNDVTVTLSFTFFLQNVRIHLYLSS
jgi:hypothetical protein